MSRLRVLFFQIVLIVVVDISPMQLPDAPPDRGSRIVAVLDIKVTSTLLTERAGGEIL